MNSKKDFQLLFILCKTRFWIEKVALVFLHFLGTGYFFHHGGKGLVYVLILMAILLIYIIVSIVAIHASVNQKHKKSSQGHTRNHE